MILICQTKLGEVLESRVVEVFGYVVYGKLACDFNHLLLPSFLGRRKQGSSTQLYEIPQNPEFLISLTTFFKADILAQPSLP